MKPSYRCQKPGRAGRRCADGCEPCRKLRDDVGSIVGNGGDSRELAALLGVPLARASSIAYQWRLRNDVPNPTSEEEPQVTIDWAFERVGTEIAAGTRCKCGLRLPCDDCIYEKRAW